jgi:WD40 repeat protein
MDITTEPIFSFPGNGGIINAGPTASSSGWINENAYSYEFSPSFTTGPEIFVDLEVSGARDQWNNLQDPYFVEDFWEILLDPTHVGETDKSNLLIYPNPVSKESNLFISGATDGTLRVFDVSGRAVVEIQHYSKQATVLSTSGWSAGIYTLSIRTESSEIRRVLAVY